MGGPFGVALLWPVRQVFATLPPVPSILDSRCAWEPGVDPVPADRIPIRFGGQSDTIDPYPASAFGWRYYLRLLRHVSECDSRL